MVTAFWVALMTGLMGGGVWYGYQQHWQRGSWLIPVTVVLVLLVLGRRTRRGHGD